MSELSTMLSASVTRLFEDLAGREVLEAAEEGTWPAELWKALEETAVTQALVPEDAGGVGASWSDVEGVLRAAGRHVVALGIAYDGQFVDKVPTGPYDMRLDGVLTPSGLRSAG